MGKIAYLSLGSNLGDRGHHLEEALRLLAAPGLSLPRRSSFYETEPVDFTRQPRFLNMVAEVDTRLFPRQLLARIAKVERQLGRERAIAKGPRTIDIDIVFFGDFVLDTPDLVIPHPRMTERRFVLEPLCELAPELRHPVTRQTMRELLSRVASQRVQRLNSD